MKTSNLFANQLRFFAGHFMQAVAVHQQLIDRFPNEPGVRNELAITYLLQNL